MIERLDGPCGPVWLAGDDSAISRISFVAMPGEPGSLAWISDSLRLYFSGARVVFPGGSEWTAAGLRWVRRPQRSLVQPSTATERIYLAMAELAWGETVSYAELAARAGNSRWARAVGAACRKNPIPLVMPCHRVLAAHGLGGYSPGLAIKRELLRLEGLDF